MSLPKEAEIYCNICKKWVVGKLVTITDEECQYPELREYKGYMHEGKTEDGRHRIEVDSAIVVLGMWGR